MPVRRVVDADGYTETPELGVTEVESGPWSPAQVVALAIGLFFAVLGGIALARTGLDLNDVHAKLARDRRVPLVISTDAHSRTAFGRLRWGVLVGRRAWLEPADVLNTQRFEAFRASLRRNRRGAA